jgi:hypothetical protein
MAHDQEEEKSDATTYVLERLLRYKNIKWSTVA